MKLRLLVTVALWLIVLAAGAVVLDWFERNKESPELLGRALLGDVDLRDAGIVLIETPGGQVTLRRNAWGWVVEEAHGFAADTAKVRGLLLRLAQATIGQRLRLPADKLGELGLLQKVENEWRFEAGRTASVLTVVRGEDQKHKLLYQVLIGNQRPGSGTYVRFPSDGRAYVVGTDLTLDGDAAHWIRPHVFEPGAADAMQRVRIRAPGHKPLRLTRAARDAPWRLHEAAARVDGARVLELLRTLEGLRIVGVGAPNSGPVGAPDAASIEVGFFDRRTVLLTLHPERPGDAARRAVVTAGLTGSGSGSRDEANMRWRVEAFNQHFAGRLVELDPAHSARLLRGRSDYLAKR